MEIRKLQSELEKGEYREFIIERSKSPHEIDTEIDRISGGFQQNESSEESYELEREEYRNYGGWEDIMSASENSDRRHIPSSGEVSKEEEERPIKNATTRRRAKEKSPAVELDLSGKLPMGKRSKIRFGWGKGIK